MLGLGNLKGLVWMGVAVVCAYLIFANVVAFLIVFCMERFSKLDQSLAPPFSFRVYSIIFSILVLFIPVYGRFDLSEFFRLLLFLIIYLCFTRILWTRFRMTLVHFFVRITIFSILACALYIGKALTY